MACSLFRGVETVLDMPRKAQGESWCLLLILSLHADRSHRGGIWSSFYSVEERSEIVHVQ